MGMYKNTRKVPGAYVWYKNEVKRITNQKVGDGFVLVDNRHKVSRGSIRLVKVGDEVMFKDPCILPKRCREWGMMKVTSFMDNDTIRTDKDESGSNYNHFVKPQPHDTHTPDS
jgi:hypothetical protein